MNFLLTKELFDMARNERPEITTRNIYILSAKKKYKQMKIIGIDIYTGRLVIIVDNNNKVLGLHKYDENFEKVVGSVIKAKFEWFSDNEFIIKSEIQVLGSAQLNQLIEKYHVVCNYSLLSSFEEVIEISNNISTLNIPLMVKFTDTILKKYNDNYQLKMLNKFVNVIEKNDAIENNIGKHFSGIALINWKTTLNGNRKYFCSEFWGKYSNDIERNTIPLSKKIPITYKKEMEKIYEEYSKEVDELIEKNEIERNRELEDYYYNCLEEENKIKYQRAWNDIFMENGDDEFVGEEYDEYFDELDDLYIEVEDELDE